MMWMILLASSMLFGLLRISTAQPAPGNGTYQYCATIDPKQAMGASGHISLQISEGVAQYAFSINLNGYHSSSTSCNFKSGLAYHVHSYWQTSVTKNTSTAGSTCSKSLTGSHYDPNFACSNSSQSASTSCVSLGRTWSQHYRYSCNSTVYKQGQYSYCEVGDVAGKRGAVFPASSSNLIFATAEPFSDYMPPYPYNFKRKDLNSDMWSSFVFHCKSPSFYLLCAEFSNTQLSACESDFTTMNIASTNVVMTNSSNNGGEYTAGDLAAGILVTFFLSLAIGAGILYCLQLYFGFLLVETLKKEPMAGNHSSSDTELPKINTA